MAADETISGFYDIGTATDVVITPYNGDTQVTVAEKNIDEDDAMEQVYVDSKKLEVVYDGATQSKYYSIILVDGTGLPTKDSTIYYIDQETANSSSVAFNVSPKLPTETTDMTLYMSSDVAGFELVSIPMSYAVNVVIEEEPSYKLGDANGDDEVDVKDVIAIRRHITGGYSVTINEAASNVNGD
ncbi:MAG: hypothetical protein IJN43_08250, partial [Ruminococcus sp.]|nr:hypothetical protein [Ruminococcus sp.]